MNAVPPDVTFDHCHFTLIGSAFDLEREREWRQKENALKVQIAQLEATLKADVGEKGTILDKLSDERGKSARLVYTCSYTPRSLLL